MEDGRSAETGKLNMEDCRIRLTPNLEIEDGIVDLTAKIKGSTGVAIERRQALEYFAELGVKSWSRKMDRNPDEPKPEISSAMEAPALKPETVQEDPLKKLVKQLQKAV